MGWIVCIGGYLRPDLDHMTMIKKRVTIWGKEQFPWPGIRLKEKRLLWLSDFSHQEERRVITSVWHLWRASLITLIDGLPCTNSFIQLFLITAITIIKAGSIMTGNHCIDEGDDNQSLIIRHMQDLITQSLKMLTSIMLGWTFYFCVTKIFSNFLTFWPCW